MDDTPIVPAGKPSIYLSEATLVPQKWPLQCSYPLLDIAQGESEEMDEELTVCLESEVMDPNDGEKQDGDMSSTMERVKSVTKNGGKSKKCMIKVEVSKSESNTRAKKKNDSAAAERLTPRNETVGKMTGEESVGERKRKKECCYAKL